MRTRMISAFFAAALLGGGCSTVPSAPEGVIPFTEMTVSPGVQAPDTRLQAAAASGDADAAFRYGLRLLFSGDSGRPELLPEFPGGAPYGLDSANRSYLWIAKAAGLGNPAAKYCMSVFLLQNGERPGEAIRLLQEAAEAGEPHARNSLGACHYFGYGVEPDETRAVMLFASAAEQGHPAALYNLGVCLLNGRGVRPDPEAAAGLFRKAAFRGVKPARTNLAWCYRNGVGVEASADKAKFWEETELPGPDGTEERFPEPEGRLDIPGKQQ
ncbi:MAG: sel1 repeat family protein [Lentisphaeria bacterium]|nr:sel1 repeat family protein [Lentisphaeria bacterium]